MVFNATDCLDSSHAKFTRTILSLGDLVIVVFEANMYHRRKSYPKVSTRPTDEECMTALSESKVSNYIDFVLEELELSKYVPTILYCDNKADIIMSNSNNHTNRDRHAYTQHLLIQNCVELGKLFLDNTRTALNNYDISTKVTVWIINSWHTVRIMR